MSPTGSDGGDVSPDPDTAARLRSEAETLFSAARRQLFLLIFTGFFLMLTLAVPDSQLVRADAVISWPLIQTSVQLSAFLTYAPIALVALMAYLHLLYGRLSQLRRRGYAAPETDLLAMTSTSAQFAAGFLLYGFVPLVLAWFSWKVVFRDEARLLIATTCSVAFACAVLHHRRAVGRSYLRLPVVGGTAVLAVLGIALLLPWADIRRITPSLPHVDWRDPVMQLRRLDLKRADLGNVDDFAIVNLADQNLSHADARFARLTGADLRDSNLTRANFRYAVIGSDTPDGGTITDFERAKLDSADLREADLRNTHFDHASMSGAILDQARLGGTRFWCADLSGAQMNRASGDEGALVFQHARLDGASLGRIDLVRPNFRYASLKKTDLRLAQVAAGDFGFADLSDARLGNGSFQDASFFEADLSGADLSYTDLSRADFSGADLSGANLTGAYGIDMGALAFSSTLCGTLDPSGTPRNDHCAIGATVKSPDRPTTNARPHPCARTQNTGSDSFLFRLQRVISGATSP